MVDYVRLQDYVYESPSGEILLRQDDSICLSPYCTCPFLYVKWSGEFNPGKLKACQASNPRQRWEDIPSGGGGYDYTFGYKNVWNLSGVIRDCDIRASSPWSTYDMVGHFEYVPYLYPDAKRFVCAVPLSGTLTTYTPNGTVVNPLTFTLAMAATTSGWIPLDFPLYFVSKIERQEVWIDDPDEQADEYGDWEIRTELVNRPCFGYAPGGYIWGLYTDIFEMEHNLYGCGFNNQDFAHTTNRTRFYSEYHHTYSTFNLGLFSTNRAIYSPPQGSYPSPIVWNKCLNGVDEYDDQTHQLIGYCLDWAISRRMSNSSLYTIRATKNVQIPTIFDEETQLPLPPSGCKEINWEVDGDMFAAVAWGDDGSGPNNFDHFPYYSLGGTIQTPPSGINKLQIGYLNEE